MNNLRDDFPVFGAGGAFCDGAYLDNAATTHKPQLVIDAVSQFYARHNASVHRGIYAPAERVTELFEGTRARLAAFLNAKPSEVIFTSGTTEGVNFVADTWGAVHIKEGDEIVVSEAEHHANLLPWLRLAERVGAKVLFIPICRDTHQLKFEENLISQRTKFVAVVQDSNVLPAIWPEGALKRLIQAAHAVGACVLLDGAQSIAHQKIDLADLDVDFFVFSAHKIMGPTGVGVLFIREALHEVVPPYQVGGAMVQMALPGSIQWRSAPHKFEAGTPPIAQAIGLGAALDYIEENIDWARLRANETSLCAELLGLLGSFSGIRRMGVRPDPTQGQHLVTFAVDGIHAHDVASMLGEHGVCVRAGNHCAQLLHAVLGVDATVRASVFCYNTSDDIKRFGEAFGRVLAFFRR